MHFQEKRIHDKKWKMKNEKKKTPPLNEKHEIQQYCYASHFLKGEERQDQIGSFCWNTQKTLSV